MATRIFLQQGFCRGSIYITWHFAFIHYLAAMLPSVRTYIDQPVGFADDILAGFYCEVDGDDTIHLEREELKEGRWVPREEIQGQKDDLSLTNEMMTIFKNGLI